MIAASLLLIAGAVTLLVMGLWGSSSTLLGASIAASVLTAVVLIIGARRLAAGPVETGRAGAGPGPYPRDDTSTSVLPVPGAWREEPEPATAFAREATAELRHLVRGGPAEPSRGTAIPAQAGPVYGEDAEADTGEIELDPPDEPAPQQVSAADAARVAQLATEVLVVDGRPRYHLPGCVHLLGRESEPLPVGEAIELGFTPCSLCEPDSALLADARRV